MHTPATHPERYECTHLLAEGMRALGIRVREMPLEFSAATEKQRTSPWDFDIGTGSWLSTAARLDPDVLLWANYHSSLTGEKGSNYAGWKDNEIDRLLALQRTQYDLSERQKTIFAIEKRVTEIVPTIPLYTLQSVTYYNHERFTNFTVVAGYDLINQISIVNIVPKTADKIIKIAKDEPTEGFSPFNPSAQIDTQLMMLYGRLAQFTPQMAIVGDQAASWRAIDDKNIEVKLRPGLKFHDGKPLTAKDVKFTFEYIKQYKIPVYAAQVASIASVEVVNDLTVIFHLTAPTITLYSTTFTLVPILPEHIWKDITNPLDWNNPTPIGSGPLKMKTWNKGESIIWEAFKDYWKPMNIEGAIWVEHLNIESKFLSLKAKNADAMIEPLSVTLNQEARQLSYLTEVPLMEVGVPYVMFNMRRLPGSDLAFRKAVAQAYDWEKAAKVIWRGEAITGSNMIARTNKYWFNPDSDMSKVYPFNLEKAKKTLADAGYEWDKGQLAYPKTLVSGSPAPSLGILALPQTYSTTYPQRRECPD